jgi:hypothetical protein
MESPNEWNPQITQLGKPNAWAWSTQSVVKVSYTSGIAVHRNPLKKKTYFSGTIIAS